MARMCVRLSAIAAVTNRFATVITDFNCSGILPTILLAVLGARCVANNSRLVFASNGLLPAMSASIADFKPGGGRGLPPN